ncbi:MAG: winged helix DNA-binding domain-containing protein [Ktedonobacterales bacterium]
MVVSLSMDELRRLRMRSQCLSGELPMTAYEALRRVTALQAQDTPAARLAVRPRSMAVTAADVTRACNEERAIVRTWAMRGTLHMLPVEDVRWMVALLGPIFTARYHSRRLELGLDAALCARTMSLLREILAEHGGCTRGDLIHALTNKGLAIDPSSQAPAHLVMYAAMQGVICRGAEHSEDEPTYVLLDEWVGQRGGQRAPDDALAELARRYIRAYGPADADDFAAWAGIPLTTARRGVQLITGELIPVTIAGEPAWMLPDSGQDSADDQTQAPCVRLLPAFDAWLLGYRRRDFTLPPRFARTIQAGGGWIHPVVVVDGIVVGAWRLQRRTGPSRPAHRDPGEHLSVSVQPFEPLDPALLPALEAQALDIGRFLNASAQLTMLVPW